MMMGLSIAQAVRQSNLGWLPRAPAGGVPKLALDFAGYRAALNGSAVPLLTQLTATRADATTCATYTNAAGIIQLAPANVLRFDRSGAPGMLGEGARTNLLLRSEEFDNASWSKATCSITANQLVSPDGTVDADLYTASGANGIASQVATISAASTNTVSCYFKAGSANFVRFRIVGGADIKSVYFNLATGAVGSTDAPGAEITAFSGQIAAAANGFYRCIATITTATVTALTVGFVAAQSNAGNSAASDTIYAWGAQCELGANASTYIPTTTVAVTRAIDLIRLSDAALTAGLSATEGTWLIDMAVDATTPSDAVLGGLSNNTPTTNDTMWTRAPSGLISSVVRSSAVDQTSFGTVLGNTRPARTKHAFAFRANDTCSATKGVAQTTDVTVTLPVAAMDRFWFLGAPWGGGSGNSPFSTMSAAYFWPTRLVNSDLVALSA